MGDPAERLDDRNMERVSGAPYHPQTQSKIDMNVRVGIIPDVPRKWL
jgi:hypothetical protein